MGGWWRDISGKNAAKDAKKSSQEAIDLQREIYDRYKSLYGPVEENLSKYYKSLGPDRIIKMGLENHEKEFNRAKESITTNFAQAGFKGSKFEQSQLANLNIASASGRSVIRSNAEEQVNQRKLNFLGVGLGQGIGTGAGLTQAHQFRAGQQNQHALVGRGLQGDLVKIAAQAAVSGGG